MLFKRDLRKSTQKHFQKMKKYNMRLTIKVQVKTM